MAVEERRKIFVASRRKKKKVETARAQKKGCLTGSFLREAAMKNWENSAMAWGMSCDPQFLRSLLKPLHVHQTAWLLLSQVAL